MADTGDGRKDRYAGAGQAFVCLDCAIVGKDRVRMPMCDEHPVMLVKADGTLHLTAPRLQYRKNWLPTFSPARWALQ